MNAIGRFPYLDLREVTYALNGTRILDSVSWKVEPGEHWAILGPNGAGKTTLLKIICGYLWPNAGGVVYRKGESLLDLGLLRRSIGWVTSTLADEIPVREPVLDTVVSGRYAQIGLLEYPWEPIPERVFEEARACLRDLGCEALASHPFGSLSQGEQQKVLVCRARMSAPYLIILDEPCAGMDPGAREVFLSSLSSIGEHGKIPQSGLCHPSRGRDPAAVPEDPASQRRPNHPQWGHRGSSLPLNPEATLRRFPALA